MSDMTDEPKLLTDAEIESHLQFLARNNSPLTAAAVASHIATLTAQLDAAHALIARMSPKALFALMDGAPLPADQGWFEADHPGQRRKIDEVFSPCAARKLDELERQLTAARQEVERAKQQLAALKAPGEADEWHVVCDVESKGDFADNEVRYCITPHKDDCADAICWMSDGLSKEDAERHANTICRLLNGLPASEWPVEADIEELAKLARIAHHGTTSIQPWDSMYECHQNAWRRTVQAVASQLSSQHRQQVAELTAELAQLRQRAEGAERERDIKAADLSDWMGLAERLSETVQAVCKQPSDRDRLTAELAALSSPADLESIAAEAFAIMWPHSDYSKAVDFVKERLLAAVGYIAARIGTQEAPGEAGVEELAKIVVEELRCNLVMVPRWDSMTTVERDSVITAVECVASRLSSQHRQQVAELEGRLESKQNDAKFSLQLFNAACGSIIRAAIQCGWSIETDGHENLLSPPAENPVRNWCAEWWSVYFDDKNVMVPHWTARVLVDQLRQRAEEERASAVRGVIEQVRKLCHDLGINIEHSSRSLPTDRIKHAFKRLAAELAAAKEQLAMYEEAADHLSAMVDERDEALDGATSECMGMNQMIVGLTDDLKGARYARDEAEHELMTAKERLASVTEELKLWKPLTQEEAERALDEANGIPISDDEISRIVAKVTDPTFRPTEPEHVQMAAKIEQLKEQLAARDGELERVRRAITNAPGSLVSLLDGLDAIIHCPHDDERWARNRGHVVDWAKAMKAQIQPVAIPPSLAAKRKVEFKFDERSLETRENLEARGVPMPPVIEQPATQPDSPPAFRCPKCGGHEHGSDGYQIYCLNMRCDWSGTWSEVAAAKGGEGTNNNQGESK